MPNSKAAAIVMAGLLAVSSPALFACDKEDEQDIQEGINDVEEGAEDVGNEVEEGIDNDVDTDGKDD